EFASHEAGVGQRTDPEHRLELLFNQVNEAITEHKIDFYLRVLPQIACDDRRQAVRAKRYGRVDAQAAPWSSFRLIGEGIGPVGFGEYQFTTVVICLADIREALPARRPVEQAGAQAAFKPRHVLGHHLRRYAESACSGSEGTDLRRLYERSHAGEAIH